MTQDDFFLLNSKSRHTPTLAEKFPATLLAAQRPASRKTLPDTNRPIENQKLMQAGIQLQSPELQALQTQLKPDHVPIMYHCNATLLLLVYCTFLYSTSQQGHLLCTHIFADVLLGRTSCLDHEKPF